VLGAYAGTILWHAVSRTTPPTVLNLAPSTPRGGACFVSRLGSAEDTDKHKCCHGYRPYLPSVRLTVSAYARHACFQRVLRSDNMEATGQSRLLNGEDFSLLNNYTAWNSVCLQHPAGSMNVGKFRVTRAWHQWRGKLPSRPALARA
jgi:hypothetical protein